MQISVTIGGFDKILYRPEPKQELLHGTIAQQILYGGAAGGGKSYSMRWDAIMFCLNNPGLQAYLFRRTYTQLEQNHIIPIQREIPIELGRYTSKNRFEFANGSMLHFNHCEHESDYLSFQGMEAHWLGIDEAGLFEPIQLIELRSRLRLGSFSRKINDKQQLPRVVFTSNPGGPSHNLLKKTFMRTPPMQLFFDPLTKDPHDEKDHGMLSIYIPATMDDNKKYLDKNYGGKFTAMSPERAKALRDGDWDTIESAALHSLDKGRHMLKNFVPPRHWTHFCTIDWGTAKPFGVLWCCVAGEDVAIVNNPVTPRIIIPKGAVIAYREWYGIGDKDNEGIRLDSTTVARGILARQKEHNDPPMDYYCGDLSMWNQVDGPSVAERMMDATDGIIVVQKRAKDRTAHYNEILARLAGNPLLFENGKTEQYPLLFIQERCYHTWRTLPGLSLDNKNPDRGPGDGQEDHLYDSLLYGLMSRPIINTTQDRFDQYQEMYRDAQKSVRDPYYCG